ncbi:MAG: permease [Caldisericia bacterium]|nr:permease [Caldisericia bacterium]
MIGFFIQNQILGMKWLSELTNSLLNHTGIDTNTILGGSLHFFIFDTLKIFILLSFLIFVISFIQSFYPPERTRKILSKFHGFTANLLSALLGTVTPFCSCSSIPLFIGFTSAGLPLGVTFSFLISSPLVDLGSLILLTSIFGGTVAIAYVAVGLILAVLGGTLIERLKMEKYIEEFVSGIKFTDFEERKLTTNDRLSYAKNQMVDTVKKVALYIFVGVGIGALIHNVIPETFIQSILGKENPFSVIIAVFAGIPMYADIFGSIPIAEALYSKGVGLGTVLSFMMAVTALSLPSIIMLRKVVKPKLLGLFIAIITLGIIIIGYLFNMLQYLFV